MIEEKCPKCGSPLAEVSETPTGRKLQRCSKGSWNSETKKNEGCDYVKWLISEPQELEEKCPKCGANLVLAETRFGKKMKKCSTNVWNSQTKKAEGCDYIEWLTNPVEELEEKCPECGEKLVMMTTAKGKKMKKCSTGGWDSKNRVATGCTYVEWLKNDRFIPNGEEFLPPEENEQ